MQSVPFYEVRPTPSVVIVDIAEEYNLLRSCRAYYLNEQQLGEIFHQIFEVMNNDSFIYLDKVRTLPKMDMLFHVRQDDFIEKGLREIVQAVAMSCFFKVIELKLYHNGVTGIFPYFIMQITPCAVYLQRDFSLG